MDVVKLFYSEMDIQPVVLLHHFLRYLGFYVEENPTDQEDMTSLADIHVISDEYLQAGDSDLEIPEEETTIFVLKDGWNVESEVIKIIYYNSDVQGIFLEQLVQHLCDILEDAGDGTSTLIQGNINWRAWVRHIAGAYQENGLLEASLFSRSFFKKNYLFIRARDRFQAFLDDLDDGRDNLSDSGLYKYASLYAKYELDMTCNKNYLEYLFPPEELLEECEDLLIMYGQNRELHLLRADIVYELQDKPWKADDLYADECLGKCAYAYYKRGKILRTFFQEYDNAEQSLRFAISKKPDYYDAKYQLAECCERQSKYKQAIDMFADIYRGLEQKYKRHLLAPMELEYMYKALMKIASIYKNRLIDYDAAHMYDDFAQMVREEHAFDGYVEEVLEQVPDRERSELIQCIEETMMEQIDLKLEKIY